MATLKELTAAKHKEAETSPFVKILFSGKINPEFYATFLYNQHTCYNYLEAHAAMNEYLLDIPELRRAPLIQQDWQELFQPDPNHPEKHLKVLNSTLEYTDYISTLAEVYPRGLLAHVYVRHFGDLYGGQMIATKVPGSRKMYQFNDPEGTKAKLRPLLDASLGDEANRCFDFAIQTFKEMMELPMPKTTDELQNLG